MHLYPATHIPHFNPLPPTLPKWEALCLPMIPTAHQVHEPLSDWDMREDRSWRECSSVPPRWWAGGMNSVSLQLEGMNGGEEPCTVASEARGILLDNITHFVSCHKPADASEAHGPEKSSWEFQYGSSSSNNFKSSPDLPSIDACIWTLQEHRKEKDLLGAWQMHVHICIIGLEAHPAIGNHLVPMFADCGDVLRAEQVAYRMMHVNEFSWTSVILGYAQAGQIGYALILYQKMLSDDIHPTSYTFVGLLKACADFKDLERGYECHREIAQRALDEDLHVGSTLVYMYAKWGSFVEAQKVFDQLPARNVVSWTVLISAYAENGPYQEALYLFDQMKQNCTPPNSWTFACAIRASGFVGSIEKAFELHSEAVQKGLEEDLYVGDALVYMYIKFAQILEARNIFEMRSVQSNGSWNNLIAGYAEARLDEEVLSCFNSMLVDKVPPNAATLAHVVKACGSLGSIERGFKAHKEIVLIAVEKDSSISNCLIGMYASCGLLLESQKVFDGLEFQSVVSWTALIRGYAEHGDGEHALNCLERMQHVGLSPDAVTLASGLKVCNSFQSTHKVWEIHKEITEKGLDRDVSLGIGLLDVYANCGSLLEAQEVFKKLSIRDVVAWTALIVGYVEQGLVQESMTLFNQMETEGVIPDSVTCSCILKACGSTRNIDKGRKLHMDMLKKECEMDTSLSNTLIGMYAKCSFLPDAQVVFDKLSARDVVSWTSLIIGYAEHGYSQETLNCFELMQQHGILGDAIMFACCLKACGNIGAVSEGQQLHTGTVSQEFEKDILVGNTLVGMYAKWGWFVEALEVFDNLPVKDIVSWNALITGYAEHDGLEALRCLEQIQRQGMCPDSVTLACALKACGSIGALERSRGLHSDIVLKGLDNDSTMGNSLINAYSLCSSILESHAVFDNLPVRDVVAWCTLIKGYSMNHAGHIAVQLFEDMQESGVKPHALVFSSLLTACSHSGQMITGEEYFKMMREDFSILPTEEQYSCMVDLLARSGHLYEAEMFIEAFCRPYEGSWASLLTACKTFEEIDLGLRCFQHLLCINPEEAAWYVLMADINASTKRGDHASYELEILRKHAGIKKLPASALIEVNNRLHEFVVGNDVDYELSAKLKVLNARLKAEGHVPKVNLVLKPISDEEKEAALSEHAEKLAIAFGLLNTPQGETLRVSKSLRMCNDCHDASKIISKVERREIILRDSSCIHHFKDGLCSCGDMF